MLNDIIAKYKTDEPERLVNTQGGCRYCGQITALEAPSGWSTDMLDELAVENCKCSEAEFYRMKKSRKERAIKAIEEQFGEKSKHPTKEEVRLFFKTAADMVVEDYINSATIDLGHGIKAKIGITNKGNVKVEKTITEKTTKEA